MNTVYENLMDVMNENEIGNHYSDLYVLKNDKSIPIVEAYRKEFPVSVSTFKSQIDNRIWYDISFAYLPYWENKLKKSNV